MKLATFLLSLVAASLHGQLLSDPTEYVLPPDARVCGLSQADMSVSWWNYNFSLSTNVAVPTEITNRVYLPAGPYGDCSEVYYIASRGFAAPPLEPTFNIPEGAYVFFPIQSVFWDNINVVPPWTEQQLRDAAAALMDLLLEARLWIDGVRLPDFRDHRQASPLFSYNFTNPDNLYSLSYGAPFTGLNDPIVADGYYVLLKLPVGMHVLSVGATFGSPINLSYDLPAYINVVPLSPTDRVSKIISLLDGAGLPRNRVDPLLATLNAAAASFGREDLRAGINQLRAFQNQVRAQLARTNPTLSDRVSIEAAKIIEKGAAELK